MLSVEVVNGGSWLCAAVYVQCRTMAPALTSASRQISEAYTYTLAYSPTMPSLNLCCTRTSACIMLCQSSKKDGATQSRRSSWWA